MSDDQDGCEWVSVSSGTGLPGLSRTEVVKRLCVCVCVCVRACVCATFTVVRDCLQSGVMYMPVIVNMCITLSV